MSDKTSLGDRMKLYESLGGPSRLLPLCPIIVRVDGRAFHTFCSGLYRPYDERLSNLMVDITKYLVQETGALVGYTQSDEISLLLYSNRYESQIYFDGRPQKIISQTAAIATREFTKALLSDVIPEKKYCDVTFDSRVFNVPSKGEAVAYFLWRERDATKNSISMAARTIFSHVDLHKKNGSEMQEMLFQNGVNWNDYPNFFKKGTYVRRVKRMISFTTVEISKLPAQHAARFNPDLKVERTIIEVLDMPPFNKVSNKIGVLFNGENVECAQ